MNDGGTRKTINAYRAATLFLALTVALFAALLQKQLNRDVPQSNPACLQAEATAQGAADPQGRASGETSPATKRKAGPSVRKKNILKRAREVQAGNAVRTDFSEVYYLAPTATVHLHFMACGQLCPLHIHETTQEATVIVLGDARVSHRYGGNRKIHAKSETYHPGDIIFSPPLCGHEWQNASKDQELANLVFSAPGFQGNTYLKENDPHLLQGREPLTYRPDVEMERFAKTSDTSHTIANPEMMNGAMEIVLVKDRLETTFDGSGETVLFVARGRGRIENIGTGRLEIEAYDLIIVPSRSQGDPAQPASAAIVAEPKSPLTLYVFRPSAQVSVPTQND